MDGPLLTKGEHNVDDVTTHGDSSSNEEHIVDVTTNDDSSSADAQTPHEDVQWSVVFTFRNVLILVEFVVALVQIVAAIVVLTLTKDEQPPQKMFPTLILSYTGCCIAALPILGLRFWQYYRNVSSETRIYEVVDNLKKILEYFFVGWVVVLFWHLINNSASLDIATQQLWLCMAFLAISCILHVFRNLPCAAICFLYPMILRLTQSIDFFDGITEKIEGINWTIAVYIGIFSCILWCITSCCSRLCR
ncbi:unnamed protein product [Arabidopsis lyrata]|uniref:Predicted protein n=1 Tax=Arabidopsis lyrata subsp. lyrata TaxID=81972 RepID=D7KDH8_ARALL|nr:uncharacterized protein LOC9326177 [Arabidopsis lyrata subsp. lyrata]EFH66374.1 predicted protein [Arabidopsis lyrata subsp. lyrata]CAH8252439.1 unnamed protein product [Arabidopsis lyrata]|eukprot:XP_002890115.1 uncharacterized protein LOC9326177 [Arabidopsis lyrata subsp. lyrata]